MEIRHLNAGWRDTTPIFCQPIGSVIHCNGIYNPAAGWRMEYRYSSIMDVMRPQLRWIDGRCYREYSDKDEDKIEVYEEEDEYAVSQGYCDMDPPCEIGEIEQLDTKLYRAVVSVPAVFIGLIVGKGGMGRNRIENETATMIRIPRKDTEDDIVITGANRAGVAAAKSRITNIANNARKRAEFTHFLSIPMTDPNVLSAYEKFKQRVLERCRDITEDVFQNPARLHLTIGTMVLLNDKERQQAAAMLQSLGETLVRSVVGSNRLDVIVHGVQYMNDDPAEVRVLYAKVESLSGTNRLQVLADQILEKFVATGFMELPRSSSVKVHLTLMNTKFLNRQFRTDERLCEGPPKTFDARSILEEFKDFVFDHCTLSSIHLSQRHTRGADGYYKCSAKIKI